MERGSPYSDSPLLSEIHTLFPALLYDSARFRNLQDVFRYVRERLRARYDIFSNATREFQNSDPVVLSRTTNTIAASRVPIVSMNFVDSIGQVAISDLIRSFLYSGTGANMDTNTAQNTAQNPTNTQIETATQRFQYIGNDNISCAVCQDSIVQNEIVRRLNACQHVFHESCLTTWFQRRATCPLCRNDIRSDVVGSQGQQGPVTSPPLP